MELSYKSRTFAKFLFLDHLVSLTSLSLSHTHTHTRTHTYTQTHRHRHTHTQRIENVETTLFHTNSLSALCFSLHYIIFAYVVSMISLNIFLSTDCDHFLSLVLSQTNKSNVHAIHKVVKYFNVHPQSQIPIKNLICFFSFNILYFLFILVSQEKETWGQYHQHFTHSFYTCRSQKRKRY